MSTHAQTQPGYGKYLIIWVWLIALLAVSTFFSYLPISKEGIILLVLAASLVKTILVCLFYMHLKFERFIPIWAVAVFPFVLIGLAVLLILIGTQLGQ
ncbi:MAG: cytochrome C oxidase subunit IV family protein [Candidatus Omnitrophica bacterium]|nr:cytochrome C oxidase subunit IV family protein [Candidatus Omnitrophota bacterium]